MLVARAVGSCRAGDRVLDLAGCHDQLQRVHAATGRLRAVGAGPGSRPRVGWVSWLLLAGALARVDPDRPRPPADGPRGAAATGRPRRRRSPLARRRCVDDGRPPRRSPGSPAGSPGWPRRTTRSGRWPTGSTRRATGCAGGPPPAARTLADPDLVESAPLSPLTFAEAEERVLAATAGVHGVLASSLVYETDALLVRATVDGVRGLRPAGGGVLRGARLHRRAGARLCGRHGHAVRPRARRRGRARGAARRGRAFRTTPAHGCATRRATRPTRPRSGPTSTRRRCSTSSTAAAACSTVCWPGCRWALPLWSGSLPFHPTVGDAAADLAGLYGPEGAAHVRRRPDLTVRLGRRPAARPGRA